jgi:hypothetical protein
MTGPTRKSLVCLATLLGVLWAAGGVRAEEDASKIYNMVLRSTCWIVYEKGQGLTMGSGSLINVAERIVLTNYHVVGDESIVYVMFPHYDAKGNLISERDFYVNKLTTKAAIKAKVVTRVPKIDLALVKLDTLPPRVQALPLAKEGVGPGKKILSLGNPFGSAAGAMWILTEGSVRQITHTKITTTDKHGGEGFTLDARVIVAQAAVNSGDSGGPCVNYRGELVGVTQGHNSNARDMSIYVELSEVMGLLKQNKVTPKIGRDGDAVSESSSASTEQQAATTTGDDAKAADAKPTEAKSAADAKLEKTEATASRSLDIAKRLLDSGFADDAKLKFQEIIKKYPDTNAAKEAKELMKKK